MPQMASYRIGALARVNPPGAAAGQAGISNNVPECMRPRLHAVPGSYYGVPRGSLVTSAVSAKRPFSASFAVDRYSCATKPTGMWSSANPGIKRLCAQGRASIVSGDFTFKSCTRFALPMLVGDRQLHWQRRSSATQQSPTCSPSRQFFVAWFIAFRYVPCRCPVR